MLLLLVGAVAMLSACGGSSNSQSGVKGHSEVTAQPLSNTGANPFTASVGTDTPGIKPPAGAASSSGGPATYNASLPGLYGGTRNLATCDATKLVTYLQQNPAKATAWASTLGIQTNQIQKYVSGLTSVTLRTDTRVTNHGYVNGTANPIQEVLQAGTGVFVDQYGAPVVRCYCGNPLTPPVLYSSPTYVGPLWSGFSTTNITIIQQSTTIINKFLLYDPRTGQLFPRTPGVNGHDGPYTNPGAQTTSTPSGQSTPSGPAKENPSVSLSPNPVTQGQTVTLSASGFQPGATLDIKVDRPDGVTEHYSTTADSSGNGSYTFSNAGGSILGTYTVTVTNTATGASASTSIQVLPAGGNTGTTNTSGNTGSNTNTNGGNTGSGAGGSTGAGGGNTGAAHP